MTPPRRPKAPHTPPGPLTRAEGDLRTVTDPLWRISATTGVHSLPWNVLRDFGPLGHARWDPHHAPQGPQPDRGVMYAATDVTTVVAEVYQKYGVIDPVTGDPHLYGFTPTRPLRLLDLTGDWLIRNGAAASLTSTPYRSRTRAWSAAILDTWPDLDGLWAPSTLNNKPVIVLYAPSRTAFPPAPQYARPLTHPDALAAVRHAARTIGYATPPVGTFYD